VYVELNNVRIIYVHKDILNILLQISNICAYNKLSKYSTLRVILAKLTYDVLIKTLQAWMPIISIRANDYCLGGVVAKQTLKLPLSNAN